MENNDFFPITRAECMRELEEMIQQLDRELLFKTYYDRELTENLLHYNKSLLFHLKHY